MRDIGEEGKTVRFQTKKLNPFDLTAEEPLLEGPALHRGATLWERSGASVITARFIVGKGSSNRIRPHSSPRRSVSPSFEVIVRELVHPLMHERRDFGDDDFFGSEQFRPAFGFTACFFAVLTKASNR